MKVALLASSGAWLTVDVPPVVGREQRQRLRHGAIERHALGAHRGRHRQERHGADENRQDPRKKCA
jgi:hypothetical protein